MPDEKTATYRKLDTDKGSIRVPMKILFQGEVIGIFLLAQDKAQQVANLLLGEQFTVTPVGKLLLPSGEYRITELALVPTFNGVTNSENKEHQ